MSVHTYFYIIFNICFAPLNAHRYRYIAEFQKCTQNDITVKDEELCCTIIIRVQTV